MFAYVTTISVSRWVRLPFQHLPSICLPTLNLLLVIDCKVTRSECRCVCACMSVSKNVQVLSLIREWDVLSIQASAARSTGISNEAARPGPYPLSWLRCAPLCECALHRVKLQLKSPITVVCHNRGLGCHYRPASTQSGNIGRVGGRANKGNMNTTG